MPNGTVVAYTYDDNDRLIQVKHELEGEVISLTAYTLDNLGNRLTKTDAEGRTTHYSYDELNQLVAVLYPDETGAIYTYDAVGNRLTANDVTYSYDAANQLVQVGEAIYTYDANGNLLSDGEKTYQYDHDNRLISLTEGETTTTYTYDGDGNRLSQSIQEGEDGPRTHEYIYDINKGLPELIVEIEGENEYIYIYAGRVLSQIGPDGQAYYHQDGLGSIDQDFETLFGKGSQLTVFKELSQPGQFAAEEKLDLISSKGIIAGFRILGPFRGRTQIEISRTDSFKIGLKPPVRDSGDLIGSEPITLKGPRGCVKLRRRYHSSRTYSY